MAVTAFEVSMPRLIATLTLRVRFVRVARVRTWAGAQLLKLAASVIGCNVAIDIQDRVGD